MNMKKNKVLNAGIVGLGRWGQVLVKSINHKPSSLLKFTHCYTRTISKVKLFCNQYSLTNCYSYEELINNEDIDLIVLASPHSQHFEQITKASKAKKHIFVEKPFTLTLSHAIKSIKTSKKYNIKIGAGFNRRFLPSFNYLKKITLKESFGEKIHVEGNFSGPFGYDYRSNMWRGSLNENPSGGMAAMGIHVIDAMISLLGPIEAVQCISKQLILKQLNIDDTSGVQLWFSSGSTGYLSTLMATAPLWRLHLFGSKAWAQMNGQNEVITSYINGKSNIKKFSKANIERLELESFAQSVVSNQKYPVSYDEIINGVATFEAITNSIMKNGKKVFIKK